MSAVQAPIAHAPATRASIWRHRLRRALVIAVAVVVGYVIIMSIGVGYFQRAMIYFPRQYDPIYKYGLPEGTREVAYTVEGAPQRSFYIPPRTAPPAGTAPTIWVFFGGNASLALDWLDYAEKAPRDDVAFFLVDYPGYGLCKGSPSRDSINAAIEAGWPALAKDLGLTVEQLDRDVNVCGFSLGAASALEFATRRPVRKVALLAPFTSLLDMARRTVFWPISEVLQDRFDNRDRLAELAQRPTPPRVLICHGTVDEIIPVAMGRELAADHPSFATFREYPNVNHNWLPDAAREAVLELMASAS